MDPEQDTADPSNPPVINYILSFLLVGVAWGFTTPFIRRAAADFAARQQQNQQDDTNNITTNNDDANVPLTAVSPEYTDETRPADERGEESEEDNPPPASHQEQQQQQQQRHQPAWMQQQQQKQQSWLRKKITTLFWTVVNLLRTPAYSIPLVVNLTGSVWFFLLVGKHGMYALYIVTFYG